MNLSTAEIETLAAVKKSQKGWPCGIPVEENMARRLVEKGVAEWKSPFWNYPQPVFAISPTTQGDMAIREHNKQA